MDTVSGTDAHRTQRSRVQEITIHTDSRDILQASVRDQGKFGLKDCFIVNVDSHHVETDSWDAVLAHTEDPILRYNGQAMAANWSISRNMALHNAAPGFMSQDCKGRIPHQAPIAEPVEKTDVHRDVTLNRRGMDSLGFDLPVFSPQPMLEVGLHPNPEVAAQLVIAYNRLFAEEILSEDSRMCLLLAPPMEDVNACLRTIREYGDNPQVLGFMITSQRHCSVQQNQTMPIYRGLEARNLPLAFHALPFEADSMTRDFNRSPSIYAMSFVICNMNHMLNWNINGLPGRFPDLKLIWVESGLAWLPFMMQRPDSEFLKRQSGALLLKHLPSEYIQEMFFTSQPMEDSHPDLLAATLKAIKADTQFLFSPDWPQWDFDLPGRLFSMPFIDEQGRRNIVGEKAQRFFNF